MSRPVGFTVRKYILTQFQNLQHAIERENVDTVKDVLNALRELYFSNKAIFEELCQDGKCFTQTDFLINACMHKKPDVVYIILYETDFMEYLCDPTINAQDEDRKRFLAFRYAICSDDFVIINMLYDYWCGYVTGSDCEEVTPAINNIDRLGTLLENICVNCQKQLIHKQNMKINIHCLVAYNKFQRDLHNALFHFKSVQPNDVHDKAYVTGAMLLKVLHIFDQYSNINAVRVPNSVYEQERKHKAMLENNVGVFRSLCHIMYEEYFRKLDFNVAFIVLEKLNELRHHLRKYFDKKKNNMEGDEGKDDNFEYVEAYEQIESKIYHFIYRTTEDWRLYLPSKRQVTMLRNRIGFHEGKIYTNLELKYDEHKIENAPVLYLEREEFVTCLQNLQIIIKKCVVSQGLPSSLDNNKTLVSQINNTEDEPLLDDNYLKEIKYLRDHYSLKKTVYYLKAVEQCDNSSNVLLVERALQVAGEMLKTTEKSYHLSPTIKALIQNDVGVQTIKNLHQIRDYLSHVKKGQLTNRIEFANSADCVDIVNSVRKDLKKIVEGIYPILAINKSILDKSLLENGLNILDKRITILEQMNDETRASEEYEKELGLTKNNRRLLFIKKENALHRIISIAIAILPKYIKCLNHTLDLIKSHNKKWPDLKNRLHQIYKKNIPDYPSSDRLNNISNKIEKLAKHNQAIDSEGLKSELGQIQDLTVHWECVKNVLEFFANEMKCTLFEIQEIKNMSPDDQSIDIVKEILSKVKTWCLERTTTGSQTVPLDFENHPYIGIKNIMERYVRLIDNDHAKTRKMKKEQLLLCLLDRIDKLKHVLGYPKQLSLKQHMLRYKREQTFQLEVEMLLVDISNILAASKARLMNKSSKLLRGIDLGNVLDHGNPFLEVIGDILDYHDFSTELLSKAMMFAQDGDGITALYKLFKDNVSFKSIEGDDQTSMTDEQKKYHNQFKMLESRCREYLKLIPRTG